jgi:hypothetical protein
MKLLTKSRFKLGLECPNKLYFIGKPEYANCKSEDSFLNALAKGGFQVEELARMHYPGGIFVDSEHHEYEKAVELTQEALKQDNVVIYEAAFLIDGYFIRTDILEKKGRNVRLIEVKAKSFDPSDDHTFIGKKGGLISSWKPYLFDLAFQKRVAQLAYPSLHFEAFLMMADKSKRTSINGLNQLFRVPQDANPRIAIIKKISTLEEIGNSVLSEININSIIDDILSDKYKYHDNLSFYEAMISFKNAYQQDSYFNWPTDFSACKKCEFKSDSVNQLLSGFEHCFKQQHQWSDEDFRKPNVLEIWNYRGKGLMEENRLLMDDITENDFKILAEPDKISSGERQWIQVLKARNNDYTPHFEKEGLINEMKNWKFPLHFIDFETSAVALPFSINMKPYEQVAFQFSHHTLSEEGVIEHRTEFISNSPGEFPNFNFVRALEKALGNDEGTIFRFANHENSILNAIIVQLKESKESDAEELITFLKSVTKSTNDSVDQWEGERSMVDLNKIVKDYYYNPYTKGSNSIKYVLPACLKTSEFLQKKYLKPIGDLQLSSKNFSSDHTWLQKSNGEIINPYKMLPPLFEGWSVLELEESISEMDGIADGGAALTAYAKLQYQDMSTKEREEITKGLLKYCELDTLAMVMIYEHLVEITNSSFYD